MATLHLLFLEPIYTTASAANFDGSSFLSIPYEAGLVPQSANDFSVDMWIRPTGGSDSRSVFSSIGNEAYAGFSLSLSSNDQVKLSLGDGTQWNIGWKGDKMTFRRQFLFLGDIEMLHCVLLELGKLNERKQTFHRISNVNRLQQQQLTDASSSENV